MRCGKIVCVGQNYREHIRELRNQEPTEPVLFLKPATALIGDGEDIVIPDGIGRVDHEVELALIVGMGGRHVSRTGALAHISHLAVFNDVTARDMQNAHRKEGLPWTLCKGMDTFAPVSEPVPIGEIGDIHSLQLTLKVNGEIRQNGNTNQMIFPVEVLVEYISKWMTLEKGDIIATGTPSGVSQIRPGDIVEASIPGVGTLRNPVRGA